MKMSYRQASIIIFYMLVAFKVLSLPSLMYQTCKNDGYMAVFIMMIVDAILVWASIKIIKQAKGKNTAREGDVPQSYIRQIPGRQTQCVNQGNCAG